MRELWVHCWIYLVVYIYDGCEGCFRVLVIFWPLWCKFVLYGVRWNGRYDVNICTFGKC